MTTHAGDAGDAGPIQDAAPKMASWRARFSWALFDWANQPYFTVITTFIFAPYFTSVVVGDPVRGQALWGYTTAFAATLVALGAPFLGAVADIGGRRKPWLLVFQILLAFGCLLLWLARADTPQTLPLVLFGLVLANVAAEYSILFNNSLLPGLVPHDRMGRLSGFGWGMGYIGGLIALFAILIISRPELVGITPPDGQALLGLDRATHEAERIIGPTAALWLLLFVTPMFLFTPDRPGTGKNTLQAAREGFRQVVRTVRELRQHGNTLRFLIAYMLYYDGLNAVIGFGGIYAAGVFGWGTTELGIFGIALNVVAIPSVMAAGWLDDKLGSKRTVQLAIVSVALGTLGILSITADSVLFGIGITPKAAGAGAFSSAGEQVFFLCAILLGLGMGPMQAASRTMVARLAPTGKVTEFYGIFSLSGRATSFMAPLAIAIVTDIFANQRVAAMVVLVFLMLGFWLLWQVREPRN